MQNDNLSHVHVVGRAHRFLALPPEVAGAACAGAAAGVDPAAAAADLDVLLKANSVTTSSQSVAVDIHSPRLSARSVRAAAAVPGRNTLNRQPDIAVAVSRNESQSR